MNTKLEVGEGVRALVGLIKKRTFFAASLFHDIYLFLCKTYFCSILIFTIDWFDADVLLWKKSLR